MKLSIITADVNNGLYGQEKVEGVVELDDRRGVKGVVLNNFAPDSDGTKRISSEILPCIGINDMNNLSGKLMTIIDASFSDKEQRKAMKDVISQSTWGWFHDRLDSLGRVDRESRKEQ